MRITKRLELRRLLPLVAVLLMLAACGLWTDPEHTQSTSVPVAITARTATSTASVPSSDYTASPSKNLAGAVEVIALAMDTEAAGDSVYQLTPMNPFTMEPLQGVEPIVTGTSLSYDFSPDGHRLAALVAPTTDASDALHLIDLTNWTEVVLQDWELISEARLPRFSPDGSAVYWAREVTSSQFDLLRYDVETRSVASIATLPASFSPTDLHILADGRHAAVFGLPIDGDGFIGSDAQVLVIDLQDHEIVATVELAGTGSPSTPADAAVMPNRDGDDFHIHRSGLAWDTKRDVLYVVHSGGDMVSVVDFMNGEVTDQIELGDSQSFQDRLTSWLFPSVTAVARSVSNAYAVLSPNGGSLYVASMYEKLSLEENLPAEASFSNLKVIDTTTGEVIKEIDVGGVRDITLTRDGKHLLVQTFPHIYGVSLDEATDHRLHLIDIETATVVQQVELPGQPGGTHDLLAVTDTTAYVQVHSKSDDVLAFDAATLESREISTNDNLLIHKVLVVP